MYKIFRAGAAPVYKRSQAAVRAWCKRNPGECLRWDPLSKQDVLNELQRLADALADIASYSEGETVTSGFDCPVHATEARLALYPEDQ